MNKKYLTFTPYRSGLSNVIMSYELAFAIAAITNRTIIMPPSNHLTHITEGPKERWPSPWDMFDKSEACQEFDLLEADQVSELKNNSDKLGTYFSWFENIKNLLGDRVYEWIMTPKNSYHMTTSDICFVNNPQQYTDSQDFNNFVLDRMIIDVDVAEQFLHFENNLFQHYWYLTYAAGPKTRNELKRKINKVFKYHKKYYEKVTEITDNVGTYNSVHVRRGDFFIQFGYSLKEIETSNKLLNRIRQFYPNDKPLYIATDEPNRNFFSNLREHYKIFFIEDLYNSQSKLETAILDQIICSQSEKFLGTFNSTFTKRINVMRGLDGRESIDHSGINVDNSDIVNIWPWPWHHTYDRRWSWNNSSFLQWTQEYV